MSLAIAVALGWFWSSRWAFVVAAALPVLELWLVAGLGTSTRDGFDNWGLLALPVWTLLALALAASTRAVRRRRARRTDHDASSGAGPRRGRR